jgi:predicted acetyltransferase
MERPAVERVASYLQLIDELRTHGDRVWESWVPRTAEDPAEFVARLVRAETAALPPAVPATTYWATISSNVVGRAALRHGLTDELAEFGGHVSFDVRPSYRRRGVATEMLRWMLSTDEARKIGSLLITCAPTNIGSNKTILANGGRLVKTSFVERVKRDTNYYAFDLR